MADYNFKIIEYPNGTAQIRLYDIPAGGGAGEAPPDLWEIEPFTGQKVRPFNDDNIEENRQKSLIRTRNMISMYARCCIWEWFVTFTFSPYKVDRTNFVGCMAKVRNWLQNTRKRFASDLKYLAVPELHADGVSWHIHLLLSDTGTIKFSDSGKKKAGQHIYNMPGWKFGFSTATRVRDTFRIQKYITKYMTKECHALASGAHRYYVSKNLPLPKESVMFVEPAEQDEMINQIADSLGLKISWKSEYKGYMNVTYIELK